nr:aminotransferase class V-fold PLP-dependent enzyme [uncultured Sphaerochaeta sp.]
MIYLNNGATSFPKPQIVGETYAAFLNSIPGSSGRSSGRNGKVFRECRESLAELFGIGEADRIFFTGGATDSFNFLLAGLDLAGRKIITTATEHNSVLRPLFNMKQLSGCQVEIVPCDDKGRIDPRDITSLLDSDTAAVIVNHCSNVTGAVQDLSAIGESTRKSGVIFLADVSQSGGCLPVKADAWGVDGLVFTGHKSLFGLQGTGGFYLKKGIPLEPYRFGGTGSDGRRLTYEPGEAPYEVGTRNEGGIAALNAGVRYILEKGLASIARKEQELLERLRKGCEDLHRVKLYAPSSGKSGPVVSLIMDGMTPSDLGYILYNAYHMVTRTGYHCCPLIHDYLGTAETGTLRCSFSWFNDSADVDTLLAALRDVQDSLEGAQPI